MIDVNGEIAGWITDVLREMGDPGQLDEQSQTIALHAAELRSIYGELNNQVAQMQWSGTAAEAHVDAWQQHAALAAAAVQNLEQAQQAMATHSNKAWAIVREIIGIILEIL